MRRHPDRATILYELFPSRWDDDPVSRARTVFAGLAGVHDVALEWTATESGLRFYVRAMDDAAALAVLGQIRAAYPQADFHQVPIEDRPHLDPLHVTGYELASLVELRLDRDAALPLDTDARRGEPLAGVLAAAVAEEPALEIPFDINGMWRKTQAMLRDSLDALMNADARLAEDVCRRDDEVDHMKHAIREQIEEAIRRQPERMRPLLRLLAVARNLERIADGATNIPEDVVYLVEGRIMRHGAQPNPGA